MVLVYNLTRQKVDMAKWQKLSQLFLDEQGTKGEVNLILVGDQRIRNLNKKYRRQDKVTDVLSFADGEDNQLGEVIIDYSQIIRQAQRFGHSVWQELIFITIHGLLHLMGYEDDSREGRATMIKLGEQFLDSYNIC